MVYEIDYFINPYCSNFFEGLPFPGSADKCKQTHIPTQTTVNRWKTDGICTVVPFQEMAYNEECYSLLWSKGQ